jgi:S-adenosylmethionine decarboxylase
MQTKAKHLMLDIWFEKPFHIEHFNKLKLQFAQLLTKHKQVILSSQEWAFYPYGNTIVFLLASSHASIHTYPEKSYISFDVYSCDENFDPKKFSFQLKEMLPYILNTKMEIIDRGIY